MVVRRVSRLAAPIALIATLGLGGGHALAVSNGGGNSANAPGQAQAYANCTNTYTRQETYGPATGRGPKSQDPTYTGPTNCDHFWQQAGYIGNQ